LSAPDGGSVETDAPLQLDAAEANVLVLEARAFARAVPNPTSAALFERLASSAASGQVPPEQVGTLQTMLELVFERGRPTNRAILQTIYTRTPRGRQRSAAAHQVNRAVESLAGQRLEEVRLAASPAGHTLSLATDRARVTIEIDATGARVASLETG
jgi:hypothetical protein